MGSPIFAGHRPADDAACVARLRAAGAYVFGKTVTTPFAFMDPGKTRNPWDPAHTPGGSSSGSAAAVAAGHVCAAIGTQTNGSVVRPAAYCGVVGFKPTLGAIPYAGVHLFSATLDTVGTFARTVADAALLASVLADAGRIAPCYRPAREGAAPGLPARVSVGAARMRDAHAVVDAAVARLATQADVVPVDIAAPWHDANRIHRTIMLFEGARTLARSAAARARAPDAGAQRGARRRAARSATTVTGEALAARAKRDRVFHRMARRLRRGAGASGARSGAAGSCRDRRSILLHAVVAARISGAQSPGRTRRAAADGPAARGAAGTRRPPAGRGGVVRSAAPVPRTGIASRLA